MKTSHFLQTTGKTSFLLLILSLFTLNLVQAQGAKWNKYKGDGFSFSYPSDWDMSVDETGTALFILYAPSDRASVGDNMNLIVSSAEGYSLDEYFDLSVEEIKKTDGIQNVSISYTEEGIANGLEFRELQYSGEYSNIKMNWLQRIYVVEGTVYILTLTTQPESFEQVSVEAWTIWDTFKVK